MLFAVTWPAAGVQVARKVHDRLTPACPPAILTITDCIPAVVVWTLRRAELCCGETSLSQVVLLKYN